MSLWKAAEADRYGTAYKSSISMVGDDVDCGLDYNVNRNKHHEY